MERIFDPFLHHSIDGHGTGASDLGADRSGRPAALLTAKNIRVAGHHEGSLPVPAERPSARRNETVVKLTVLVVTTSCDPKIVAKVLRARGYVVDLSSTGASSIGRRAAPQS